MVQDLTNDSLKAHTHTEISCSIKQKVLNGSDMRGDAKCKVTETGSSTMGTWHCEGTPSTFFQMVIDGHTARVVLSAVHAHCEGEGPFGHTERDGSWGDWDGSGPASPDANTVSGSSEINGMEKFTWNLSR